jgi:gamma-glutamylcysteine synthetase
MSPIDDLTYDVITVLHSKAKALAAYDRYVSDAEADDDEELRDMFSSMRRQDEEAVQQLKEVLAQRLAEDLGYVDDEEDEDEVDDDEDYDDEADSAEVEDPASGDADAIDPVHGGAATRRGEPSNRQR